MDSLAEGSSFTSTDGMRVRFVREGHGPAVLLLHGSGSSLDAFDGIAARLCRPGNRAAFVDFANTEQADRSAELRRLRVPTWSCAATESTVSTSPGTSRAVGRSCFPASVT